MCATPKLWLTPKHWMTSKEIQFFLWKNSKKMQKKMILTREQSVKHLFPSKNIQQLGFTVVVYSMKNFWIKVKKKWKSFHKQMCFSADTIIHLLLFSFHFCHAFQLREDCATETYFAWSSFVKHFVVGAFKWNVSRKSYCLWRHNQLANDLQLKGMNWNVQKICDYFLRF